MADALSIPCRFCDAEAGEPCRHTTTGVVVYRHDTRWIDVHKRPASRDRQADA